MQEQINICKEDLESHVRKKANIHQTKTDEPKAAAIKCESPEADSTSDIASLVILNLMSHYNQQIFVFNHNIWLF